jgi:hypothetical protein
MAADQFPACGKQDLLRLPNGESLLLSKNAASDVWPKLFKNIRNSIHANLRCPLISSVAPGPLRPRVIQIGNA